MFVRPCWRPQSTEEVYSLIEANPWALLVNNGDDGPFATRLPLMLDRSRGSHGVLLGHLSVANEHAGALLAAQTPTLVVFEGPYSFVTASWYPKRDMPSTFYYTAVHCYGRVRIQEAPALEATLEALTSRMEAGVPNGWKIDEIPRSEITRRLPGIIGFELEIDRIEGKFKLGQDEPRKDAMAVADRLAAADDPLHRELAEAVRHANAGRPADEDP